MNLNEQPQIIGLANALALDVNDPVEAVRDFCRRKVERFMRDVSGVSSILELQRHVCMKLNLTVHEVWSDKELNELSREYVNKGHIILATLSKQLSSDAFGVLFRFPQGKHRPQFVAVIDCRDDKHQRRYWTLWHEIAHALTDVAQFQLPLRRTTLSGQLKDPIEQITDIVAADFAFFEPLFRPIFRNELANDCQISFDMADRVRRRFCASASVASTVNACVKAAPMPTAVIEAGLEYKKSEHKRLVAGERGIQPSLRVLKSFSNQHARGTRMYIPLNMRVPQTSVIHRVFSESGAGTHSHDIATESLADWTTSQGRGLPAIDVKIEAKGFGDRVWVLITCV